MCVLFILTIILCENIETNVQTVKLLKTDFSAWHSDPFLFLRFWDKKKDNKRKGNANILTCVVD